MKNTTVKQLLVMLLLVNVFSVSYAQENLMVASMNQPGLLAVKSYTVNDVQAAIQELKARVNDLSSKLNDPVTAEQEKPELKNQLAEAGNSLSIAMGKLEEINKVTNEKKITETKPTSPEALKRAARDAADKKVKEE